MHCCLISTPDEREGEIALVQSCFEAGLNCFHLRKPGWGPAQYDAYISAFSPEHRRLIQVHAPLSESWEVRGRHLAEREWRDLSEVQWKDLRKNLRERGQLLSVSLHHLDDKELMGAPIDYAFFSPVYDSISKQGYTASASVWEQMKAQQEKEFPLIALGGVRPEYYSELYEAGFSGVALLGAFWNAADAGEALEVFWNQAKQVFET